MKTVGKIFDAVEKLLRLLSGLLLVAFTILTLAQVVMRYVFSAPLSWSEQLARYLFIWMLMLYMPVIMRHGDNLGFDLIVGRLPKRTAELLGLLCELLICGFAGLYCFYSVQLCGKFASKTLVGLGIKANWVYSAQVVGAGLLCLFTLELLIGRACAAFRKGEEAEEL